MIAKGKIRGEGAKLARYLMTGHPGEHAQLFEARGLERFGPDPVTAFDRLEQWAGEKSQCRKAFFHGHVRIGPAERLSDAQWKETVDRMEKRLGFEGQPRIVSFHINSETGEKHLHVGWFRVDLETQRSIDPGLYKNKLNQLSRECERDFALRELTSRRRESDRANAAGRDEFEEARRLGTDIRTIRAGILDCFEKSDNGKALKAALEDRGLILANGDRRDCFVVVDHAGGQHALNKKLTGLTLAETRGRLVDLDRSQLLSVDQAKELQAERQAAREAREREKHGGRDGVGQGTTRSDGPAIKPLGKTAGEIRTAWGITRDRSVNAFAEEIAQRGLILVHVSREEAAETYRAREFAKAIERQNRALKEGFAVVDRRGNVTRIDQRTTGDHWEEIQKRLGGIDRAELMNVSQAKTAQRETNRAEFRAKKEAERAQERINAPVGKTAGDIRAAWILSRDRDNPARDAEQLHEALAARGLVMACVDAADIRQNERVGAFAKEIGNRAPVLREGELVAVNNFGNVYRFNERTTGELREEIDRRLAGIDPAQLMNVGNTGEAMREASREEFRERKQAERDAARPTTTIEAAISDAYRKTADGKLFAEALDKEGLAVTLVTAADIAALDALRRDQELAGIVADAAGIERDTERHFARLREGELAAVTRQGDVYRISAQQLEEGVEARLAEAGPIAGVIEARATFEIEREALATFQQEMIDIQLQRRADATDERIDRNERWDEAADARQTVAGLERDTGEILASAETGIDRGAGLLTGVAGLAAKMADGLADFIAPAPPPTKEQMREQHEAAKEVRGQRAARQEKDQRLAQTIDMMRAARARTDSEEEEERAREWKRKRDADLGRDLELGRER
jgi:hypothetical protein